MRKFKDLLTEKQVLPSDIFKNIKELKRQLGRLEKLIKGDKLQQNTFGTVNTLLNNINKNLTKIIGA